MGVLSENKCSMILLKFVSKPSGLMMRRDNSYQLLTLTDFAICQFDNGTELFIMWNL